MRTVIGPREEGSVATVATSGGEDTAPATSERLTPDLEARIARLYPLGRLGLPEDVAKAVTFLASDGASHITGQTLSVSDGYTMV